MDSKHSCHCPTSAIFGSILTLTIIMITVIIVFNEYLKNTPILNIPFQNSNLVNQYFGTSTTLTNLSTSPTNHYNYTNKKMQRLVSANSKDDDGNEFGLSEEERKRLLEEAEQEIENIQETTKPEIKENVIRDRGSNRD